MPQLAQAGLQLQARQAQLEASLLQIPQILLMEEGFSTLARLRLPPARGQQQLE